MSRNEWEQGTVTLPTAAVPSLKKALRDWSNALHDTVRAEAVRLHKTIARGSRNHESYRQSLHEVRYGTPANGYRGRLDSGSENEQFVRAIALQVLDRMLWATQQAGKTPRQPILADVNLVAPKMTSRDETFPVLGADGYQEAQIVFRGRDVLWSVAAGNHAVEHAHAAPLAHVFFAALHKVVWTRGTGGQFVGNDEYNEDSRAVGGGANYITRTFGPLGDQARITEHMRNGFSRSQATEMVQAARRDRRLYGRAR
jgi:hypothetical protein